MNFKNTLVLFGIFTILSIMYFPGSASASLLDTDVTVELVGADADNGGNPQTQTVVPGIVPEFSWTSSIACGSPDETVSVNVDDSTIWITVIEGTGFFQFCNSVPNLIDNPLTIVISDLFWINDPNAIVTGISVSGIPPFGTNAIKLNDHAVQITLAAAAQPTGTFEFHYDLQTSHVLAVSGELLPIDSTALFLAGMQSSAIWLIPSVVGIAGVGYYVLRAKMNKDT